MRMIAGRSAGLTLIELLAAMLVLLVGVYSVAALFPQLSRNIGEEGRRTEMSRSVEAIAAAFQSGTDPVPDAVSPRGWLLGSVDPDSRPADPDRTNFDDNPANSRDDYVWVYGEEFTVPAPASAGGYPAYVPRMGLVDVPRTGAEPPETLASVVRVVELREMKEAYHDPLATGIAPAPGEYYLSPDGHFHMNAPQGWWPHGAGEVLMPATSQARLEYDWYSTLVQRVPWERVYSGAQVQAVTDRSGGAVMPGHTRARARWSWSGSIGLPDALNGAGATDLWYVVDQRAGQAVHFPRFAAGRTLRIDYRIRTHGGGNLRRAPIMWEDRTLPGTSPYQIQLNFGHLDDENPLFEADFFGTPLAEPEWVMMVDMTNGRPIVQHAQSGDPNWEYLRGISHVDFPRGIITLHSWMLEGFDGERRRGRPVRIYYRTMDQHMITVQRAPAEFVEVEAGVASSVEQSGHRTYRVGAAPPFGSGYVALYGFRPHCEGHTVQVDYTAGLGILPVHISNEMHVIGHLGSGYGYGFVLNTAHVQSILSVRGTSLRVSGWWRTEGGRVSRLDVTSMVFPWSS